MLDTQGGIEPGMLARIAPRRHRLDVIVSHGVPMVSAGLCTLLRTVPECRVREWNSARRPVPLPQASGAHVVLCDAAGGREILERGGDAGCMVVVTTQAPEVTAASRTSVPAQLCVDCELQDLLEALRRAGSRTNPQPRGGLAPGALRRVCEHIERHITERVSVNELAAIAGLSDSHFCRAFKQTTGATPHHYLLGRRVAAAAGMIRDGARPIAEIALAVGFFDQSHFTRIFRRITGETPRAYRHRHR